MARKKNKTRRTRAIAGDSLENLATGLGTKASKRSHSHYRPDLSMQVYQELEWAYQGDWLARAIIDKPVETSLREWREIKCQHADAIRIEEDRHNLPMVIADASRWASLYGGAIVVMITNQDLEKPLRLDRIKKGDLHKLVIFDRYDLSYGVLNTTNIISDNYMLPEYYIVNNGQTRVHWSHIARFSGAPLPRRLWMMTNGWGDSDLRKCMDDMKDYTSSKGGIADLLAEANVDVITREGLSDELANDQEGAIIKRYSISALMKSNQQTLLLDGEEKYDRKTLALTGVSDALKEMKTAISGASGIPVTELFGTSAEGMNATGEGDRFNYYNMLTSRRAQRVEPPLRVIDEVLVRSAVGEWHDDFNYQWRPLEQMNEKEQEEARRIRAERDRIYLEMNVVTDYQVAKELADDEIYHYEPEELEDMRTASNEYVERDDDGQV